MMSKWIKCDGYKNLPIGNWLVLVDDDVERDKIQTCVVLPKFTMIGNHFAFDMKTVLAYMPQPSTKLD